LALSAAGRRRRGAPARCVAAPRGGGGTPSPQSGTACAGGGQPPNFFVFSRGEGRMFAPPVRSVRGPRTAMADPHGIYIDETHDEIVVANHGNFRPGELITSYTAYDAGESRLERAGRAFDGSARGRLVPSSVAVHP